MKLHLFRSIGVISSLVATSLVSVSVNAAWSEPNSYKTPTSVITLGSSGYSVSGIDDSMALQKAIDDVNAGGGGHVIIPAGQYQFSNIKMKSDVHVRFDTNADISPYTPDVNKRTNMFNVGKEGEKIENVSLTSISGRAKITLTANTDGSRFVDLGDVTNFKISKFNIADTYTVFSSIIFTWQGNDTNGRMQSPTDGTINNITVTGAHYGYGLIQAHSAKNLLFKNLKATGGVGVRLETGLNTANLAAKDEPYGFNGLYDIAIEKITSINGQGAVMLQAHTLDHGDVTINNVIADGSEFAVSIKDGFIASKYTKDPSSNNYAPDLTKGTWKSINVNGVLSTFRNNSIVTRYVHLDHYPEELHSDIYITTCDDGQPTYRGPSIAAVFNGIEGDHVAISNVTAHGYTYHPDIITDHDLFTGNLNGITKADPIIGCD